MLSNARRVEMCYNLLSTMLPDSVAANFGFSTNSDERIFLAYTNQIPRPETKTAMYFTIRDEAYKQAIADPHHYTNDNVEVLEQMRQITLTIDIYSKQTPTGCSNDVARWLNTALISDAFDEWRSAEGWPVAIENIENVLDLSYLLEGNTWNNRAQLIVKLNYRDNVKMFKTYMTRKPINLQDTPNSVNAQTVLKH